jgi:hypothetical protein
MSDLASRYGDLTAGLYGSAKGVVKFIILPIVMILIFSTLLDGVGTEQMLGLGQALLGLKMLFIVFGSFLAILGLFYEFYPSGSWSRLLFGEVRSIVIMGLGYILLTSSGLQEAIKQIGPDIDMLTLFWLYAVVVGLSMLYIIGEWIDFRLIWQKNKAEIDGVPFIPRKGQMAEDPEAHRVWHDFRFRYGRLTKGFRMARSSLLRFVIIPVVVVIIVRAVIASLDTTLTDDLLGALGTMMTLLFFVGIPIAALSFFKGFYPKGSVSRMISSIIIVALLDLWIWYATFQGKIQVDLQMFQMDLNYQPYVLLVIFGASLWALYYVVELLSYRKDWIAQNFQPVDEKVAAQRRSIQKEIRRAEKMKERSPKTE